jgi:hypothetical protein
MESHFLTRQWGTHIAQCVPGPIRSIDQPNVTAFCAAVPYDRWVRGGLLFPHVVSPLQLTPESSSFCFVSYRIVPLPLFPSRLVLFFFPPLLLHLQTYYCHREGKLFGAGAGSTLTPSSAAMGSLGGGCQTELSDGGVRPVSRGWWTIISPSLTNSLPLLQGAPVLGTAARSGCRRLTWRSRSRRPRPHRSSRQPVRSLLFAASALAVSVVCRLVIWLHAFVLDRK